MDNRQFENTNAPKVKNITATARVFGALPNIWGNIAMLGNLLSVASEIKKYKKKIKISYRGDYTMQNWLYGDCWYKRRIT